MELQQLKLAFCFMETSERTVVLRQTKFCAWKVMDIPISLFESLFSLTPFEYGSGGIFILLRWVHSLHQTTWGHKILYADRSSEDELTTWRQNPKVQHHIHKSPPPEPTGSILHPPAYLPKIHSDPISALVFQVASFLLFFPKKKIQTWRGVES
jgi:hypothetical protein